MTSLRRIAAFQSGSNPQIHFTSKNVNPVTKTRRRATLAPTWNQVILGARCNYRPVLLRIASYRPYLHLLRLSLNSIGWSLRYPQLCENIFGKTATTLRCDFPRRCVLEKYCSVPEASPSLRAMLLRNDKPASPSLQAIFPAPVLL